MPWLRTGTVACTLNSTTVTGTGTGFVANARVGDAFLGPDGRWYEVANIASDTALSILPAYLGATVSGGAYALAPMQGYVKDSADQLRALVNKFSALAAASSINALAAVTGSAGKFPYFTAADQMALATLTDYAKSGQNSDIKALTGLTTALGVSQGGTGGNTPATARNGLGLGSASIVDVVGLMANNAIYETGSSSSGIWTKYADGTMITQLSGTIALNITLAYGSLFYGSAAAISFPQTFVGAPRLLLSVSGGPVAALWVGRQTVPTTTNTGTFIVLAPSSLSNAAMTVDIVAIGRWKA